MTESPRKVGGDILLQRVVRSSNYRSDRYGCKSLIPAKMAELERFLVAVEGDQQEAARIAGSTAQSKQRMSMSLRRC